jgi:thiopeptide-type bacteriocin biosynthesis protein
MSWAQVFILFNRWEAAEQIAVTDLAPALARAETAGSISSWFFVRKQPCWRLRFRPADPSTPNATAALHQHLAQLIDTSRISAWTPAIYEPESHAFGGPTGMAAAHELFHRDSHSILTYLADAGSTDKRRELSILLYSQLLRSAGQDWYEQGDIWARVGEHRALPVDTAPDHIQRLQAPVRRLLTIDPTTLDPANDSITCLGPAFADWTTAFTQAGTTIAELAQAGTLTRGVRAVLAHHILFAWNRLGLPYATQSLLADTAKAAVFDD